jgi:hypothetical protein
LVLAAIAATPLVAHADKTWKAAVTSGGWTVPSNWNEGAIPLNTDNVFIVHADATSRSISYVGSYSSNLRLDVDNSGSGTNTLAISAGFSLTLGTENIGLNGRGVFNQSAGTHTVTDTMVLGSNPSAVGSYNLSANGNLVFSGTSGSSKILRIGWNGTGLFTQSGGDHEHGPHHFNADWRFSRVRRFVQHERGRSERAQHARWEYGRGDVFTVGRNLVIYRSWISCGQCWRQRRCILDQRRRIVGGDRRDGRGQYARRGSRRDTFRLQWDSFGEWSAAGVERGRSSPGGNAGGPERWVAERWIALHQRQPIAPSTGTGGTLAVTNSPLWFQGDGPTGDLDHAQQRQGALGDPGGVGRGRRIRDVRTNRGYAHVER